MLFINLGHRGLSLLHHGNANLTVYITPKFCNLHQRHSYLLNTHLLNRATCIFKIHQIFKMENTSAPECPIKKNSESQSVSNEDKADILRNRLSLRKRPEDVDYIGVVANIFKNIINLEKEDRKLVQVWIDKFEQQRESATTRQCRNEYARYLEYSMKDNTLYYPFNKPPPEDQRILKNLEDVMESCEEELERYKNFRTKQGIHHI